MKRVKRVKRVLLTQVAIADYRDAFFRLLVAKEPHLRAQVGVEYFEPSIRTSDVVLESDRVRVVDNIFIARRKLCWQRLNWREVVAADVLVGELNPRIISTWATLLIRRLLRKRSVLWGHAWARSGVGARTEPLRHLMRLLADGLLFYTHQQRREIIERYPGLSARCFVAPNSLYSEAEMRSVLQDNPTDFIYVGRLVKSKKADVLIRAFQLFAEAHPESTLHIVGAGDDAGRLNDLAGHSSARVIFHGHVSDPSRLADLYGRSVAAVSPGYVGLSIIQSFAYGIPMIVSRSEPHSPELESFVDGLNGSFFSTDDPDSLREQMEYWYERKDRLNDISRSIVQHCRETYSVERMVSGFLESVAG